jgi:hypothetical protein
MTATWTEKGRYGTWAPRCQRTPYQRINHHGNTNEGRPAAVEWIIPGNDWNEGELLNQQCVLRVRYNTSSKDFDGWGDMSKVKLKGNPQADFVGIGYNVSGPLRLNINTAQFFRKKV